MCETCFVHGLYQLFTLTTSNLGLSEILNKNHHKYNYIRIHNRKVHNAMFLVLLIFYRYASLFFCCAVDEDDNVLFCLELIYRFVQLLDQFFGSVMYFS